MLVKLLIALLVVWGVAVAGLLLMETRMVFPAPELPRSALQAEARRLGVQERTVVNAQGMPLYAWRRGDADKLVLFFSGNAATVGGWQEREERYLERGFATLHVNYRGYPGSPGVPSEDGLITDGLAAWEEALRTHPPERILVHAKSLGGGVALGVLSQIEGPGPAGLILESTFKSIANVAWRRFPVVPAGLLMRSPFRSIDRAPQVAVPTLVTHSQADELIPVSHGRALAEALPNARYVEVADVDHNADLELLPEPAEAVERFLVELGLSNPPAAD